MASSSNPPEALKRTQDYEYLYASITNVSNFVSVKLSGYGNYHRWKTQMLCLMQAHDMCWLIDDVPIDFSAKIMKQYDSLLKGWIFGSVSDDVLGIVVDLASAEDVWMKLKSCFDSTMSSNQDSPSTKIDTKTETKDNNKPLGEITTNDEGISSTKSAAKGKEAIQIEAKDSAPTKVDEDIETAYDKSETETNKLRQRMADLKDHFLLGEYFEEEESAITETMNSDGTTLLHTVIEKGRNDYIELLLWRIGDIDLTLIKNLDGHTVLHVAAIIGNKKAAALLVKRNPYLLYVRDNEGHTPLDKANQYGHRNVVSSLVAAEKQTNKLQKQIQDEQWRAVYLNQYKRKALTEKINSDGCILLHKVVEKGRNDLVKRILYNINYDLTKLKNSDGSTVLHIAAIVGNTDAAVLLVKENKDLLHIKDNEGKTPLDKAIENEHDNTIAYLKEEADKKTDSKELRQLVINGKWFRVFLKLRKTGALTDKIDSDGNTLLHIVVGKDYYFFIDSIVRRIGAHLLTEIKNSNGSTALHVAATVGSTDAANVLVKKNKDCLHIKDNEGKTPLDRAYENMHLDTIAYLLEAVEDYEKCKKEGHEAPIVQGTRSTLLPSDEIGVDLLVNAISAKKYEFASNLISKKPEYAVINDNALMAIARTFPSGLDYGERLIYPSLSNTRKMIVKRTKRLLKLLVNIYEELEECWPVLCCEDGFQDCIFCGIFLLILYVPGMMIYWICHVISLFLLMVYSPFFMLYLLWWKVAATVVSPMKRIEQKQNEHEKAKKVLKLVLEKILEKRPGSCHDLYTGPILEAACQDAYEVVNQILGRWPEAIRCKDKNGYDIIQLATIHRSERIYNLIYIIGERKSIYRTIEDSSRNNMLHLAGRLAPSNKLKHRTGAALQLQSELQWRQEVKKLVFPTYATKENVFMETPEMVFTKEHENLVKEGEQWFKTVAESCSITAALITTIVFAAAITVPGGSNQDTGIPVFTNKAAFTIFAIADAISLFSSATALLVFLSVLTARFAEHDFQVRLPRRLIIGLCTLLISTTAMMIAFSATLILVFSHLNLWVLTPICAFALLPIAFFFVLQFPLILDLLQSTYVFKFGKSGDESSKLVKNNLQFMFSK